MPEKKWPPALGTKIIIFVFSIHPTYLYLKIIKKNVLRPSFELLKNIIFIHKQDN